MKKIKTLIVGSSGLVGGEILKCVSKESQEIFLLSRRTRGIVCLLYTSPSPRDVEESRMPSSA